MGENLNEPERKVVIMPDERIENELHDRPILIPLNLIDPHPLNPRLVPREDVIAAIEVQIKMSGFDHRCPILVRPLNGRYQIINGHTRTAAAKRAGLDEIPAWIEEMDDDAALMKLLLSNEQAELSPLERGLHALAATEKGKHGRSIRAYAEQVGRPERTVYNEVQAAKVALKFADVGKLVGKPGHLTEIHAAPENCWLALVRRMLDDKLTVDQTTAAVKAVNLVKPPKRYEVLFAAERMQEMTAEGQKVEEITGDLIRNIERCRADLRNGFDPDKYLGLFEAWLTKYGPWDKVAVFTAKEGFAVAQIEEREEVERKALQLKRAVTLTEWKTLTAAEQAALLAVRDPKAKLNKQTNTDIGWAKYSTNPVTGCLHGCDYCYARDIADEIYAHKFEPALIPAQLAAPLNMKPPKEALTDPAYRNIFLCSMSDLMGNWVPREWIETQIEIMRQAPEWNFLLLTKYPQRYKEFDFPDNAWLGTSIDQQARVANAERAMREVKATVKWLSLEPLLEPVTVDFSIFQWVVIGGASKSTQTPEWIPPRQWLHELTARAMEAGCVVYHKSNLNFEPSLEFPGFARKEPEHAPEQFHCLKHIVPSDLITLDLGPLPAKTGANGLALPALSLAPTPDSQLKLPGWVPPPISTGSILPDNLEDQHPRPNQRRKR